MTVIADTPFPFGKGHDRVGSVVPPRHASIQACQIGSSTMLADLTDVNRAKENPLLLGS